MQIIFFLTSFLLIYTPLFFATNRNARVKDRLRAIADDRLMKEESRPVKKRQKKEKSEETRLSRWFDALATWMIATGMPVSLERARIYSAVLILVPFVTAFFIGRPLLGLVYWGALYAWIQFDRRRRKSIRLRAFERDLPEMLRVISGALRAGNSFFQAIDMVARDAHGLLGDEFRRMIREMSLGVSVEEAIKHAVLRIQSGDFELIANAFLVSRQVGGNLAEVLETVEETIRDRIRLKGEIRSLTAQGRMSMWIFLLMTPGIAVILDLFNPGYLSLLFSNELGLTLVALALLGQITGALLIRKIVQIEV
ncbi:type II secretion system F family protein [Ferroacidibacillus organovorans]|uniref:Type II secretion system protein GspF domain-containing protein n=1 Tax=Ferroacidibacillus organovorans TaxID=1765683 RepID=A0A162SQX0_9BACL|nr:type II secretion system F family protein [Ferroacidibacillus organovorans]KYP80069.1 hypothetical protein AYJ22_12490 [Ferroacidibacillus organovorans]KYP80703.1 hypothetical protein AYJ22_10090 [Ferroacidibacillus organovorans]OAG93957.1 hypothetical protein AYW79_07980 [Ferroacidibacillus organovorans]